MVKYSADNTGDIRTDHIDQYKVISSENVTISKGDTLYSLAKKYLGDEKYWTIIAQLNAPRTPYDVEVGEIIKIPKLISI